MNARVISLIGILCAVVLIYAAAGTSKVYVGDECFHERFAKYYYELGRPTEEPNYKQAPQVGYKFTAPIFWYWGLSSTWKAFHSFSPWVTQGYQLSFLMLLLFGMYSLCRAVNFAKEDALLAVWFTVSCPMVAAFSILLYQDVPACALAVLTLCLIFRKHFWIAGICYGISILAKQYNFLLGPGMLAAVLVFSEKGTKRKALNLFLFFGLAFLVLLPDILFRLKNFGFAYYAPPHAQFANKELDYWYVPASVLHNPFLALAYLGVALGIGMFFYAQEKNKPAHDCLLGGTAIFYCAAFGILFPRTLDMRYFMPAVCLLIPLMTRAVSKRKAKILNLFLYLIFIAQVVSVSAYVHHRRQIPQGIAQGFEFIRSQTPEKAVVFYPGESIMNFTGRTLVWQYVPRFQDLFWSPSPESVHLAMREASIDFVVIPENRIYDDSNVRHTGGYPRSFVTRVKTEKNFSFLKKVYQNSEISIWEVVK